MVIFKIAEGKSSCPLLELKKPLIRTGPAKPQMVQDSLSRVIAEFGSVVAAGDSKPNTLSMLWLLPN